MVREAAKGKAEYDPHLRGFAIFVIGRAGKAVEASALLILQYVREKYES